VVTKSAGEKAALLTQSRIRLVTDRMGEQEYAEPWAASLRGLKTDWRTQAMERCSDLNKDRNKSASGGINNPERRRQVQLWRGRESIGRRLPFHGVSPLAPAVMGRSENMRRSAAPIVKSFRALWREDGEERGGPRG